MENLRSRGLSPVTTEQALEIKEKIGAWSYVECSSRTKENLEYLFDEVVQFAVLNTPIKPIRKKRCAIMILNLIPISCKYFKTVFKQCEDNQFLRK